MVLKNRIFKNASSKYITIYADGIHKVDLTGSVVRVLPPTKAKKFAGALLGTPSEESAVALKKLTDEIEKELSSSSFLSMLNIEEEDAPAFKVNHINFSIDCEKVIGGGKKWNRCGNCPSYCFYKFINRKFLSGEADETPVCDFKKAQNHSWLTMNSFVIDPLPGKTGDAMVVGISIKEEDKDNKEILYSLKLSGMFTITEHVEEGGIDLWIDGSTPSNKKRRNKSDLASETLARHLKRNRDEGTEDDSEETEDE